MSATPAPSSSTNHPTTSTEYSLPNPPTHPISSLAFNPTPPPSSPISRQFFAASWDSTVRLYQLVDADASSSNHALSGENKASAARQLHSFQHEAPVLDVCWLSPTLAASGGVDRRVRLLDLETGTATILGKHSSAVSRVRYEPETRLLVTASWDKTIKLWDATSQPVKLVKTLKMPEKVLAMDVSPPWPASALVPAEGVRRRLVVAMAARQVRIYDLEELRRRVDQAGGVDDEGEQWEAEQTRESSLKYMVRDVRCNPNGIGFATSSIEGRISYDFFDPSPSIQSQKYAFKCHRLVVDNIDVVYPVNCMGFHPIHGTFFSLGGDAVLSYWDPVSKKRIRQLPSYPTPLSCAAWSADGKVLVVASGAENVEERPSLPNEQGGLEANGEVGGIGKGGEGNVVLWVRENAGQESKPKPPRA